LKSKTALLGRFVGIAEHQGDVLACCFIQTDDSPLSKQSCDLPAFGLLLDLTMLPSTPAQMLGRVAMGTACSL
jgi:hypothetical protein